MAQEGTFLGYVSRIQTQAYILHIPPCSHTPFNTCNFSKIVLPVNDCGFGSWSVVSHPRRPRLDLLTVRGRRDALEDSDVLHRCVGDHQTSVAGR